MPEYPARQWLSSAPDIGAAVEGAESAEAALSTEMENDTPYPSLAIHEDIMATSDVPSQSPSRPTIGDVAISGRSHSSLSAEDMGEHPPHQPDIVEQT